MVLGESLLLRDHLVLPYFSISYPRLQGTYLRVTNPFAGRFETSLDLHALSTPLAFILSQDQTLKKN